MVGDKELGSKPEENLMGHSTLSSSFFHLSGFAVLKIGFRDCYIVGKHITTEVDPSLLKIFSFAQTGI